MTKKALLLIKWVGCPRNVLLKARLADYLEANGWSLVPLGELKSCDLVVFCTCGFTRPQQERHLRLIDRVHRHIARTAKPPVFVVAGCLPPILGEKELAAVHRGPAVGVRELDRFDSLISAATGITKIPWRNKVKSSERIEVIVRGKPILGFSVSYSIKRAFFKARCAFHRVLGRPAPIDTEYAMHPFDSYQMGDESWCVLTSLGCRGKCSYCAIKLSKGRLTSRPLQDVMDEIREGVRQGYRWVSLIADDNGIYGKDIGTDFGALLREINSVEGDFNLLIDSLGPHHFIEFYDDLGGLFESGKMKRICLAIQHVSPRILDSMNRPYDGSRLKECLRTVSAGASPVVADGHFIVGYPGETDSEFDELLSFARWFLDLNPRNAFKVFEFSANPGTAAARLENRVPPRVIAERARALRGLRCPFDTRL